MASKKPVVFRVFVSSTFSDLAAERDALQRRVWPELDRYCRGKGARFQAVDLRWGIADEAALDQRTMTICLEELRRCQQQTPRPNFVILLGDRYGWLPAPPVVPANEFEALLEVSDDEKRLRAWYRRDDNATPPEYVLLPRTGRFADHAEWASEERAILDAFAASIVRLGWPENDPRRARFEQSATHQEIEHGAFSIPDAHEHVFAYLRQFDVIPVQADDRSRVYADYGPTGRRDAAAGLRLLNLRRQLESRLPPERLRRRRLDMGGGITTAYLDDLCAQVFADLRGLIDAALGPSEERAEARGLEAASHAAFAAERASRFRGQQTLRSRLADYLAAPDGAPLAVAGPGGSGKSALLAQAFLDRASIAGEETIVCRFLGTTPASSNAASLLGNVCEAISAACDVPLPAGEDTRTLQEWAKVLEDLLHLAAEKRPVRILLDALDQVEPASHAHELHWLPTRLPPSVGLVVSTLAEDGPHGACLVALRARLPGTRILDLHPLHVADADALLRDWLADAARTLRLDQRRALMRRFGVYPRPLFLKLLFEEARRWRSDDGVPQLPGDTSEALENLFDRLERDHGAPLVRSALAHLTASRFGLAEDELADVLSQDRDFFESFLSRIHHPLPERRLPPVIWSRLRADLGPYVVERGSGGEPLLAFHHRQLAEAATRRYLRGAEAVRHEALSNYFAGQPHWYEGERDAPRRANVRKASEAPYQLSKAGRDRKRARLLCDLEFVEAKCAAGLTADLIADYAVASDGDSTREYGRFVSAYGHLLNRRPDWVWQLAVDEPERSAPAQAARARLDERRKPHLRKEGEARPESLLRTVPAGSGRVHRCAVSPDGRLIAAGTDSGLKLFDTADGSELTTLAGNEHCFSACDFATDGRRLLAGSYQNPFAVWDVVARTELVRFGDVLQMNPEAKVLAIAAAMSPGGDRLVFISRRGSQGAFEESHWGELLDDKGETIAAFPIEKQYADVFDCALSPDGNWIATTHGHRMLHYLTGEAGHGLLSLWDARSQRLVMMHMYDAAPVVRCAFAPDSASAAIGGWDGVVKIVDLPLMKRPRTLGKHSSSVNGCRFASDGRRLLTASADGTVVLWDAESGVRIKTFTGHADSANDAAFLPDGSIVSTSDDGTFRFWHPDESVGERNRTGRKVVAGVHSEDARLAVDETGSEAEVVDIGTGRRTALAGVSRFDLATSRFAPDGTRIAIGLRDGRVALHDTATGQTAIELGCHGGEVCGLSFTPDGGTLASVSVRGSMSRPADFARVESRQPAGLNAGEQIQWMMTELAPSLKLWNATDGTELATLPLDVGREFDRMVAQFAPDGRLLVLVPPESRGLRSWNTFDAAAGVTAWEEHQAELTVVALSPEGQRVLTASVDGEVRLWELAGGRPLIVRTWQEQARAAEFSPDGRLIACLGSQGIAVRDVASGRIVAERPVEGMTSIAWTPNGSALTVSGERGRAERFRLRHVAPGPKAVAAVRLYRFDRAEWDENLTFLCGSCCERSGSPDSVLEAIDRLAEASKLTANDSPVSKLPSTAWTATELKSRCPRCDADVVFVPFRVDRLEGARPEIDSGAAAVGAARPMPWHRLRQWVAVAVLCGLIAGGAALSAFVPWGWIGGIPIALAGIFLLSLVVVTIKGWLALDVCPKCGKNAIRFGAAEPYCPACDK